MMLKAYLQASIVALLLGAQPASATTTLHGAGATLPAPLYKHWIERYRKIAPAVQIEYEAVGSGEGVRRFMAGELDFGASDAGLNDEQLSARPDTRMIPVTAVMIALAYNLPGLNTPLRLSREAYVGIFDGSITQWDDPRIRASNPGVELPKRSIALAVRLDSSGTTEVFSAHLSAISEAWRDRGPGTGKRVRWPAHAMFGRGNEGVAMLIKTSEYSIGYVDSSYAHRLNLQSAWLENRSGRFVAPSGESGAAALAGSADKLPAHLRLHTPDPEGANAYPLTTFSYWLLPAQPADPVKGRALKQFVGWSLDEGQKLAPAMGYVPLPEGVASRARSALNAIQAP